MYGCSVRVVPASDECVAQYSTECAYSASVDCLDMLALSMRCSIMDLLCSSLLLAMDIAYLFLQYRPTFCEVWEYQTVRVQGIAKWFESLLLFYYLGSLPP